jgi:hypothetical protein
MLYVDVDALCKLAHWKMLPHLPELTGRAWGDMATVSSIGFRAERCIAKPDGRKFHTSEAAAAVKEHVVLMAKLGQPDSALLEEFANIPQIDEGEAVLLSLTAGDPNGKFLTGDKRALRGLVEHAICEQVTGRIIIVEQVLQACMALKGVDWLRENVCPHKDVDKAIASAMGSRCDASVDSIGAGFASYVREIFGLRDPSILYTFNAS